MRRPNTSCLRGAAACSILALKGPAGPGGIMSSAHLSPSSTHLDSEWSEKERALIAKAQALAPIVASRADEAEKLRRIPDATDRDFREAGFFRCMQPARYGGLEGRYGLHTVLAMEIARGCASSGWILSVTACHSWIFGMFPLEAQDEIWKADPGASVASSFLAVGPKITLVEGGIRVSGRWRFSSHVNHCQCAMVIGMLPMGEGRMKQVFILLHRDQYKIEDQWNVIGLAATGSNDIVVEDTFVPTHRMLDVMTTRTGTSPGSAAHSGYTFSLPLFAPFAHSLVGAAVGAAQGALDLIVAELESKTSVANVRLADQQTIQTRVAEATAEIEAARALLTVDRMRINEAGKARLLPDDVQRTKYRLDTGYATKLCVQAVERLLPVVGGRGLELGHPLQRAWRDVHAVAQHIALTWDVQALNYGAVRLGGKAGDPRI
jgi:3-hydroxy-9,10-secoandrosta-1,3,5(10)-triene-9,17-dione monooxygenase